VPKRIRDRGGGTHIHPMTQFPARMFRDLPDAGPPPPVRSIVPYPWDFFDAATSRVLETRIVARKRGSLAMLEMRGGSTPPQSLFEAGSMGADRVGQTALRTHLKVQV
jgi:hypothetical protein